MKAKILRLVTLGAILSALLIVGCASKNAPCPDTDPAAIEDARSDLTAAQGQLQTAQAELQAAEAEKAELERNINNRPEKAELEQRLYVLKKGSGR